MTVNLSPAPPPDRRAPWSIVALATFLVVVLGLSAATVAHRAGHSEASVSIGYLSAAQAKTAKINDLSMTMTMTMTMSGHKVTVRFAGEMSQKPRLMSLTTDLPEGLGRLDERVVGKTLYMHTDTTNVQGKHWLAYTTSSDFNGVVGQTNPLETLQSVTAADGAVKRAGTSKVHGVQTTHYKAKLDPKAVLAKLPKEMSDAFGANQDIVNALPEIPVDIYIADDGTIRRFTEDMNFSGMKMSMDLDLSPLGHRARVVAPPARDVSHVSSFTELMTDLGANF